MIEIRSTDCIGSCKFNYHAITATTAPETDSKDEDKQNKNTPQYVLDTTIRKQTHMVLRKSSYKQLGVKTNRR